MNRRHFLRLIVGTALVANVAWADPAAEPLKVVAFGDSTTAFRDTIAEVYSVRLEKLLRASGVEATVVNAGIGGSHTGSIRDNDRFKIEHARDRFEKAVRSESPQIVVIQFGWNDSWADSNDANEPARIPLAAYRENLTYFVETLKADGVEVILMTPNPPQSTLDPLRVARIHAYVATMRLVAARQDVPLVDIWAIYRQLPDEEADALLLDVLHPNDGGHALVAAALSKRLLARD